MKQKYFRCMLTVFLVCILLLAGCSLDLLPYEEPSFVDRSVGWKPSVKYKDHFDLLKGEKYELFYYSFLFEGSDISKDNPQYVDTEEGDSAILEKGLRAAFHDRYIDCGSARIKKFKGYTHYVMYYGGQTAVVIDTKDGRIVQCVDTRIQKQIELTASEIIHITVDLANLTDDEVEVLSSYANGFSDYMMPKPFADPKECPLDAETAFVVSSKNLYKLYSSGRWKHLGDGPYVIYDAEASNSWLIIGKWFTMLLDKDTGEKKFFSVWKDGFEDLSKRQ